MTTAAVTGVRTRSRDGLTILFGAWLMIGLFVDGYVHNTRGEQLESFFTPWHGLLYSGFVAAALWITAPMFRAQGSIRERLAALPDGYAGGALGAFVFGVGGLADSIWHSVFGIEVDVEALLSPPHLVLFAGAMLILTTPARAAWRRSGRSQSLRGFLPALGSITLATLLVGFFFMYSSGLFDFHATAEFAALFADGARFAEHPFLFEVMAGFGVVARLFTTAVLMIPALVILRRWDPPRGTFTVLFTSYGAFMVVLETFRLPEMVAAAALTGVVADVLVARLAPRPDRPHAVRAFAAVVPAVLWLAHFALLAIAGNLGWPFELWGGVVIFAAGAGYLLSLLAVPPAAEA